MTEITVNIRRFRKKMGLSQSELAQQLNVTRQTVSSWENGKTYPDLDMVVRLSEALETDPNHLLYPKKNKKTIEVGNISLLWTVAAMTVCFLTLTFGSALWVPLFSAICGGGVAETFLYPIYGVLILLVGLIVFCTSLIIEELRELRYKDSEDL
ncbi:MAG: helix-turn-helix transcriptional regulator [Oscillospiraceae bacterium]|nr:helix-turn-helix transcriptional regulator [Oscillospiraceae bacterium]